MKRIIFSLLFVPGMALSSELEFHRGIWESKDIDSYSYTLRKGGVFGYSLFKIQVKDGVCKANSKYIFKRTPLFWKKDNCKGKTIDDLYEAVEEQIALGVVRMEISHDENYSFISSFTVEPKTDFTDQDWYFEITKFKVK